MWQLTPKGENSSSPLSPTFSLFTTHISKPVCKGLFHTPGVCRSLERSRFHLQSLHRVSAMDLWSRGRKSLMLVSLWFLQYHVAKGWQKERPQVLGRVRVLMSRLRAACWLPADVLSRPSDGVRTDFLQGQSNAIPACSRWRSPWQQEQWAAPHFRRMYPYTARSLPNLIPLPRRPGVSLCSRRELTSFFPSVRKRWSKVFKRQ